MRFKLKSSYIDDKDNLAIYYVVSYPMPNQLLYKKLFFNYKTAIGGKCNLFCKLLGYNCVKKSFGTS